MFKTVPKFPARTKRNRSILEAIRVFEQDGILKNCWVAGRVVGVLDDGFVLQDESGRIEINNYELRINNEPAGSKELLRNVSCNARVGRARTLACGSCVVGDIVEIELKAEREFIKGQEAKTVYSVKSLNILVECQSDFYIRREDPNYLKMVIDLRLKELMVERAKILKGIRDFFWGKGFLEVETPELVRLPGMEPHLDVFQTTFTGLPLEGEPAENEKMFLITSPEYAMKKLLVAGHEKIFQITKSFRNKEHESTLHNPEFTMIEWYRAFASYEEIMKDIEELVSTLVKNLTGEHWIAYAGNRVDVSAPWERVRMRDLFKKYANIECEDFEDEAKFRKTLKSQGYKVSAKTSYDDMFFMVFLNVIEPNLGVKKPTIVFEYPARMAALSKKCEHDPKYAERFEVYIAGMELCNAFTELNDPVEQRERLEAEREERQKMGKKDYPVDQSFIRALEFGMPPSGGIALGVDRLVMLLTGVTDIRDVLFFPHRDL